MMAFRIRPPRSLALDVALIVTIALAFGVVLAYMRMPAPVPTGVQRALDTRPLGERAVDQAQQALATKPNDPRAMTNLASAYLLRVRETGDSSYYPRAEELLRRAAEALPDDADVLIGLGSLASARHDFATAATYGQRAVTAAPSHAASYGVLTDALVELGRYDEAIQAAQQMMDIRPDQSSYSRVSYIRELHGDVDGAIAAMRVAVAAGAPDTEPTAWSEAHIGNLLFAKGDLDGAEREYQLSLMRFDHEVFGRAGLARVQAARGDLAGAAQEAELAVQTMPLPEFVALLGDIYAAMGDTDRAAQQYELVGAMQRLFAANGVRTDLDIAGFDADHGIDLDDAVAAARAEYAIRPSVTVSDVLSWVEYRAGDLPDAARHSREALRLGSQDPLMLYHAGVIAQAVGDAERGAMLLRTAYAMNPSYFLLWQQDLTARVAALDAAEVAS
ncbi:MAG: hypothetical protein QOF51_2448 [Chloroflexota bacterium]|nr:hypothetical protein [Chloroflexota bacterium]